MRDLSPKFEGHRDEMEIFASVVTVIFCATMVAVVHKFGLKYLIN